MKKILIVENEDELAENIQDLLSHLEYETAHILKNATEVIDYLKENSPDLILMDILLDGNVDGIDLTRQIRKSKDIPTVFITAYSDLNFLERVANVPNEGYILKPFSEERLRSSLYLAFRAFEHKSSSPKKRTLQIRDRGHIISLLEDEIMFLKADGLYTKVYTKEKQFTMRDILKDVMSHLPEERFIRVHKSYIVNLSFVHSINSKELIVEKQTIPLRRGFFQELKAKVIDFKERSH
ncbi:LytR/AlgR family response regulator transcription factor [Algoriphagus winogradskyi]|uniref:Two component transcriptional regulator, LytTR family n=1 Tax=Algoriphagus winogradskyi TaxID=237017 RepID=A0ABY1PI47_9BACT|nr:response regulator [Algoriphagus winogradskyi]SMP33339.1 two component transcriptional regulator, LytTR family [Algoriphagus winogradskyi]|tara:strand:- start:1449 stop:2162 length:714 start_codon:yes stop_codon:yes gene_type:complete